VKRVYRRDILPKLDHLPQKARLGSALGGV
jgi:hypothetical protein